MLLYSAPGYTGKEDKASIKASIKAAEKAAREEYWRKEEKKAAKAPEAALARMQESVEELEKQATTSWRSLVDALQAWEERANGAYREAYTAQRFIGVRKLYYPLGHSVEQSEIYAQECEIANRVSDIRLVTYGRACAAKAATTRAQAVTARAKAIARAQAASVAEIEARLAALAEEAALAAVAEEEAAVAAPLAKEEAATGPEIQRLKARCSKIISAEGC